MLHTYVCSYVPHQVSIVHAEKSNPHTQLSLTCEAHTMHVLHTYVHTVYVTCMYVHAV